MAERRQRALTDEDVEAIKEAVLCHKCVFTETQRETLSHFAENTNRVTKIASTLVIVATVGGVLSGIWLMIKHFVLEIVRTGSVPK